MSKSDEVRSYAVFILSHGRANNVRTYDTLRRCGYTGRIYIIVDDEDDQYEEYVDNFGQDNVILFEKSAAESEFDTGNTKPERAAASYARSQVNGIAESLGITHFIQMDDDYTKFSYRYIFHGRLHRVKITRDVDKLFGAMFDFLDVSGAIAVSPAQPGDFVGGMLEGGKFSKGIFRKCMNVFFCRTDRKYIPYGALNDDVTTYVLDGQRGKLFFTVTSWMVDQIPTQKSSGGMTEAYAETGGTYVKSFYTLMYCPSCINISTLGEWARYGKMGRVHHMVKWNNCTPMILSDRWRRYRRVIDLGT